MVLNRNKIGEIIGRGGQGVVHRYNKNKVIKATRSSNKNYRVEREYLIGKKAGNLGVGPKIYNSGRNGNFLWYTMNYLNGVPLKSVRNKSVYKNAVINKVKKLHNAGIAHLDLHEDNIFITRNGRVYIIDYGASRMTPNGSAVTNNQINNWLERASNGKRWYRFYEVGNRKLLSNRSEMNRIF